LRREIAKPKCYAGLPGLLFQRQNQVRKNCDLTRDEANNFISGAGDFDDSAARCYAASKAGTGNAVTDLIFSMAKREVTFFNATAPMSFL
jgi:hypothetical protein